MAAVESVPVPDPDATPASGASGGNIAAQDQVLTQCLRDGSKTSIKTTVLDPCLSPDSATDNGTSDP